MLAGGRGASRKKGLCHKRDCKVLCGLPRNACEHGEQLHGFPHPGSGCPRPCTHTASAPSHQLRDISDLGEHREPPALLPVSVSGREEPPRPAHAEGKPGVSAAKPQTTVCSQRIKNADRFRSRDAKYLPSEHHAGVLLPAQQNPL